MPLGPSRFPTIAGALFTLIVIELCSGCAPKSRDDEIVVVDGVPCVRKFEDCKNCDDKGKVSQTCPKCNGAGQRWDMCYQCFGQGVVQVQQTDMYGNVYNVPTICPNCQGRKQILYACDRIDEDKCPKCKGTKRCFTGWKPVEGVDH